MLQGKKNDIFDYIVITSSAIPVIGSAKLWLKEEAENTDPPTLADYIQHISKRKVQAGKMQGSQLLYNLKDTAGIQYFLIANSSMDMARVDEKFSFMIGEHFHIRDKLKPIERRLATLKKHIGQADIYMKHKNKMKLTDLEQVLSTVAHNYLSGMLPLKMKLRRSGKFGKAVYSVLWKEQ